MKIIWRLLCSIIPLLICSCAITASPDTVLRLSDVQIDQNVTWQGRVLIDGQVEILRGATVTVLPGTEIAFVRRDDDGDLLGDSALLIKGSLYAEGTRHAPIRFQSASAKPRPGDWKEIRADFSGEIVLRYCEIRDSVAGLHAHYTKGLVEDCWLRKNIDGIRFGEANFTIRHCLIEQNQAKGILTRSSTLQLENNIFRHNGVGLFFMEEDRGSRIEQNNFYANHFHLRLGDFSQAQVNTTNNWLGSTDPKQWRNQIYDNHQDADVGVINYHPANIWQSNSGPRDALNFNPAWKFKTGGFVDASPLVVGDRLYAASWDGHVYALNQHGQLIWKQSLGAEIDATPVASGDRLFVQTWHRQAAALTLTDGQLLWRFDYPESPADDHRQGALLPISETVLLPAWGGTLYALDAAKGEPLWQLSGHLPLRAAAVKDGERLYLSSGDGTFSALDLAGNPVWSIPLGAPLLSSAALTPEGPVVAARDGVLSAFDRQGGLRWQQKTGESCYYSAPNYHGGYVYLATAAGGFWKLAADTGQVIWQLRGLGAFYGSSLIEGARLYIGNNSGKLYAINSLSGDILATFQAGRDVQSTPTFFFDRLVFGSRDGNLYGLDLLETDQVGSQ